MNKVMDYFPSTFSLPKEQKSKKRTLSVTKCLLDWPRTVGLTSCHLRKNYCYVSRPLSKQTKSSKRPYASITMFCKRESCRTNITFKIIDKPVTEIETSTDHYEVSAKEDMTVSIFFISIRSSGVTMCVRPSI